MSHIGNPRKSFNVIAYNAQKRSKEKVMTHNCPACNNPMRPPRVSVSRYHETYICSDCGVKEALEGDILTPKLNNGFKLPDQTGFDPWPV